MDPLYIAGMLGLLVAMFMGLIRALLGRTPYDRILAVNMFGTKTVLAIAMMGFLAGRPEWMDIALLYALINFIGTIAVLKFMHFADIGWQTSESERGDN